ncbi:MAG: hypothetical protein WB988_21930 [Candidatus Nitrosopolaris sp.]|jgi:hypothetical protein
MELVNDVLLTGLDLMKALSNVKQDDILRKPVATEEAWHFHR